ncbi:MAG TPA: PEP/pyruvate-binding domain-containing protein [Bacteroidota bacterium]|nr:PEP/pyruvate-binding domain-containing protein [Bacteroidota bacterium]
MSRIDQIQIEEIYGTRVKSFQKLMRFKIRDILLVSSLYDEYLFEEDGRLYELLRQEFQALNLSQTPDITHVTSGREAIDLALKDQQIDLIIATLHIEDMHVVKFATRLREAGIKVPIILLAYDNRERKELLTNYDTSIFDRIFIWQGDYHLLLGIIKYVEDRMNVENDTMMVGVQSIILVEDNVAFYSSYLPIVYTEILNQSKRLLSEGVNLTHKFLRMRARPKILLCTTFEEAWMYYEKYQDFVLGIISDINFRRNGVRDPEAGITFAKTVRSQHPDIPILLQSSNAAHADKARALEVSFLRKGSPTLLHDLREFMVNNFGFGDFVFRTRSGEEVGRAFNLKTLEDQLQIVPDESILYHAERNHFSNWLKARTEFWLAHRLRPRKISDFQSVADLRNELINSLRLYRDVQHRGVITEFSRETFDLKNSFARIGLGSLGGKARGLGFMNTLITNYHIDNKFEDVEVSVPSAVVIATDVFDRFLDRNDLELFALNATDDTELNRRFADAPYFPEDIVYKLAEFLEINKEPLAVRSSSLLEDSQYQPFAGVYQTFMIPNNNPDPAVRLHELLLSIKLVYASTYSRRAKDYMKATAYRLQEEKMAVIIQRMVGARHGNRFYPAFAGVGKSYNFYPVPPQDSSDGIVQVALGLGKLVVDGGNAVRFCPRYPRHLLQFFSTLETIRNAQQEFLALNLDGGLDPNAHPTPDTFVERYDLSTAEEDQTLYFVGSTYSPENDSVYDGVSRSGKRVVTFAPVLKHGIFPLAEILELILEMGTWGMGTHVEIEFAVNMKVEPGKPKEFAMLQIRPLVLSLEVEELDVDNVQPNELMCESRQVLGNGAIRDIHDVVVVDIEKFDRSKSRDVAAEISAINTKLVAARRPYVLIGVGRWGSLDPWLGIPVTWDQISGASVIVESGFKDFNVTPSQGSHFFQNITSFRIGYFTVNSLDNLGFIDWEWLSRQKAVERTEYIRHLRFSNPIDVRINGHKNKGIILKPKKSKPQVRVSHQNNGDQE